MPANSIASAAAPEATLIPTAPAAPQSATAATQTFNTLLGNLIEDTDPAPASQPAVSKRQPSDADSYTAQLMTNQQPAQVPQPVLIPAAVLRMHFYFPATPTAKAPDTKRDESQGDSGATANPQTANTVIAPSSTSLLVPQTPVTQVEQQPVATPFAPAQQQTPPASVFQVPTPQTTAVPTTVQPAAVPQLTTQSTQIPQAEQLAVPAPAKSATAQGAAQPPTVSSKKPARKDGSDQGDTQQAPASSPIPVQSTPIPVPAPQQPVPQSVEPLRTQLKPASDTQSRPSTPAANQTSAPSAPAHANQSSSKPEPDAGQKASPTSQFSVSPEGTAPLPHAELAFAARLTVLNPPVVQSQAERLSQAPLPAQPPGVTATTAQKPAPALATPAPAVQAVQSVPVAQQPDTKSGSDLSQDPKPPVKLPAKTQGESEPIATEVVTTQKAAPLPQAASTTLPAMPIPTAPTVAVSPDAVKTTAEPASQPIDSRPEAAALPQINTSANAQPVRDLSIRIGDNPSNQVDVKIQERSGEVHVAVLSSSPALSSDLRQQVGDLVGKLDRAGYHAETFKPGSTMSSQQPSNQSDPGQQQGSAGGQQQQQEDARQQLLGRQKKNNQSQWLQQMNGNFGPVAVEGIEK